MNCEAKLREAAATIARLQAEVAEKDTRIAELRAEVAEKDAEIAELESEKGFLLTGFVGLYNTASEAFMSLGKEEKKKADTWKRGVNDQPTIEFRAAYMEQFGRVMINALAEAPSSSMATTSDESKRFTYSLKTLNENRATAIIDHVQKTGSATIKTPEAKAVLETHEDRKIDSKSVWRAMDLARQMMKATKSKIGKVARLTIPDSFRGVTKAESNEDREYRRMVEGGDLGKLPGPRKDRVEWDPD